jgi:hypothetical protein
MIDIRKIVNIRNILELILMIFLYAVLDNFGGMKKYAIVIVMCLCVI